jgi:hypothetical protein
MFVKNVHEFLEVMFFALFGKLFFVLTNLARKTYVKIEKGGGVHKPLPKLFVKHLLWWNFL